MILIFDLFQTLVEVVSMDSNLGLKPFWNEYYKDKCSFDEIRAYGAELFLHMQDLHKQGYCSSSQCRPQDSVDQPLW